ncbi:carbohydrate ABC transporter permease [Paenibacillus sp. JDR-2]|uniref:carbohydrate ABC transporter permease n=1 Tax=Paenibacillus sp. (strain JDR-2) TaxID=324057 RepID=UPI00016650B7|nr:sugar ABC transporter permease [Paenibacillus sp. JDR-2]ACT02167.1 binding-protein-dependent transport systems inner membrane component [Paenibacillus sp. JDR-2]
MKAIFKRDLTGYAFISPFVVGFLVFTFVPILASLYLSFTDYDLFTTPSWVGIDNYHDLLTSDKKFWKSLKVTFLYVFIGVPLRLFFALMVAMLLNTASRAVGVYRTLFYLPSIIGGSVAVSIMWRNLYGDKGIINGLLQFVGLDAVRWFADPMAALWMLITLSAWQFGSSMLIFLAGLKNIPVSLYEASSVDGANGFNRFFKITVPMLTPIILFNAIMQTIGAFMTFVPAYIISKGTGGPLDGTLLYSLYLFRQGFQFFDMGTASAMAWIMLVIVSVLTAVLFLSSKYWVHYESKEG